MTTYPEVVEETLAIDKKLQELLFETKCTDSKYNEWSLRMKTQFVCPILQSSSCSVKSPPMQMESAKPKH